MAVRKGRSLAANKLTDLSKNGDHDQIVIDIKRRGEKTISIANLDDQRARETGERPARRLD